MAKNVLYLKYSYLAHAPSARPIVTNALFTAVEVF